MYIRESEHLVAVSNRAVGYCFGRCHGRGELKHLDTGYLHLLAIPNGYCAKGETGSKLQPQQLPCQTLDALPALRFDCSNARSSLPYPSADGPRKQSPGVAARLNGGYCSCIRRHRTIWLCCC